MRWSPGQQSEDIEDRRDEGGGGGGIRGTHLGCGGVLLLLVLSFVFKTNLFTLFDQVSTDTTAPAPSAGSPVRSGSPEEERRAQFVSFVLDDVQKTWDRLLPAAAGVPYEHAKLVMFRDGIRSACGLAESASGPFYCPGDRKVYIDLAFFDELKSRFGANGEFAQAYVVAHELGHHVQNLLGIDTQVHRLQESRPRQANELSVRLELQADCLAGVWGNSTAERNLLQQGDAESALNAARQSETIASRGRPPDACSPSRSRTARRNSGSSGSGRGSRRAR
jgi:predicted metalloprotease